MVRKLARDAPALPGSPHVLILIAVLTTDDRPRRIRGLADSVYAMDETRASSSAMSLDAAGELSRTDKRPPIYPHCVINPSRPSPSGWGATHPAARTRPDSPSRLPTPVLRASSIIFVQVRELQSRDGGERITGVAGWPGGGLEKRKTRFLPLSPLLPGMPLRDYAATHRWITNDRWAISGLTLIYGVFGFTWRVIVKRMKTRV